MNYLQKQNYLRAAILVGMPHSEQMFNVRSEVAFRQTGGSSVWHLGANGRNAVTHSHK